jgi:hypothetical protein
MQGPNRLAPEASLAEEGCEVVPPECRKCLVDGGYPWPHPDWGSRGPTWAAAGSSIPPATLPSQHQPASTRTASRRGSSSIRHSPITKCSMQSKLREQNPVSIKPLSKGNCPRMGPAALGQNTGHSLAWLGSPHLTLPLGDRVDSKPHRKLDSGSRDIPPMGRLQKGADIASGCLP